MLWSEMKVLHKELSEGLAPQAPLEGVHSRAGGSPLVSVSIDTQQ